MKQTLHLIFYVSLLLGVLTISSCGNDDNNALLKVSSTACAFKATGGEKIISVGTDQNNWKATLVSDDKNHFEIFTKRDEVRISALRNESDEVKKATVQLTAGNARATIVISQAPGGVARLVVDPEVEHRLFNSFGGTQVFKVKSNYQWKVVADASWVSVVTEEDIVKITVPVYSGAQTLQSTLTFSTVGAENAAVKQIAITQQSKQDNPYYALLGKWEIHCASWAWEGEILPGPTYPDASFILEELVPGERYLMRDFFQKGTAIDVYYDQTEEGIRLSIPTAWIVADLTETKGLVHYLVTCNYQTRELVATYGFIYANVENMHTMSISGIPEGLGLGLISVVIPDMKLMWWIDMYYALTPQIKFIKSLDNPASTINHNSAVANKDIPRSINPRGIGTYAAWKSARFNNQQ